MRSVPSRREKSPDGKTGTHEDAFDVGTAPFGIGNRLDQPPGGITQQACGDNEQQGLAQARALDLTHGTAGVGHPPTLAQTSPGCEVVNGDVEDAFGAVTYPAKRSIQGATLSVGVIRRKVQPNKLGEQREGQSGPLDGCLTDLGEARFNTVV